jgi:uncharacterized protein
MLDQRHVAVGGTGLASGPPDRCRLHVSVTCMAESAAEALNETVTGATNAIAALADIEIERCEARTTGLSVQDFFDNATQRVSARVGSYQIEVVIRPIAEVGGVLSRLSSAVGDALQIRSMQLEIEDLGPLKAQARRLAIQDAKGRALELSEEAGVRLGAILSIQDDDAAVPQPQRVKMMSGAFAATSNLPIEAGHLTVASSVTMIYGIEE